MTITNHSFAKRAVMVLAVLFTTLTAGATNFITEVKLIGTKEKSDKETLIATAKNQGWSVIDNDLNAGAGGDYIYLLYKEEENYDGLNHGYITDFYITNSTSYPNELSHQGHNYKLVPYDGSDKFIKSKGDLNRGAGGDYIHLYYTTEKINDQAVCSISFDTTQSNAVGNEGGSEGYDLNNGCENAKRQIYMHFSTDKASSSVKYTEYTFNTTNGLKGNSKTCDNFNFVSSNDKNWSSGWYVVSGYVEFDGRINVSGTVNLILCDGCKLIANYGITVDEGNTLNIFAQSNNDNAGTINSTGEPAAAGIGGYYEPGGTVIIHGGIINAKGGGDGAGIGGGSSCTGGTVTIYAGTVTAQGGDYGAGIGGGKRSAGGTVTIYGGTVIAYSGFNAAGIGGGGNGGDVVVTGGAGGTVTIYGGTVKAYHTNSAGGAGIGGGVNGAGGTVKIYGGTVSANSGNGVGIGAGKGSSDHGTLEIGKGVTLYGGDNPSPTGNAVSGPVKNVETRYSSMSTTYTATYEMRFVLGNGSADIVKYLEAGTTLTAPTGFSRGGYLFIGWSPTVPATVPAGDKTFTAQWAKLLTNKDITVSAIPDQTYTGSAITPAITVKDGSTDITSQCDIKYKNNTEPGTATVTITAKSSSSLYSGETTATFSIIYKGDANGDKKVDAADLVEMVNAKNGKASNRFILKNADTDGDGRITQTDLTAVENLILK